MSYIRSPHRQRPTRDTSVYRPNRTMRLRDVRDRHTRSSFYTMNRPTHVTDGATINVKQKTKEILWNLRRTKRSVIVAAWTTDNRWPPAVCSGRSSMALFTCTGKLDSRANGARCAWAMAVHHAAGISRQRNSSYRPSKVNIMAQDLSTPDPSISSTHLSIRRGRTTTTHYTHHQVSLMVSRNTTLVPSLGLRIVPACETGLSWHAKGAYATPKRQRERAPYKYTRQMAEQVQETEESIKALSVQYKNSLDGYLCQRAVSA